MTTRIKLRRDTAANWTQTNPVLAAGEPGLETDTGKVKYGNGTSTWSQLSYGGGDGATLTAEGNVIVTAGSTEHWIATQRSQEGDTKPRALRYDSLGNLYSLTSTFEDGDGYPIAVLTKYTAAGAIAWQKSFSEYYPVALAIDSSDRAYITLNIDNENSDIIVMQFESTGTPGWKKEYDIGMDPSFLGYIEEKSTTTLALAFSVVVGDQFPNAVLIMEISITDGSVLLKKSLQLPEANDLVILTGIDVDPDENVFVTGYYNDANAGIGKMFIEKLDEDLGEVWSKSLEAPDNYDMYGGDCASDALGNIYVVGTYEVKTINSNPGNDDDKSAGILTKLNSSGVVQWTRRLGPGPCGSWIAGVTATATGDVYLSSVTFAKKTGPLPNNEYESARENLGQNKMIVARYDTQGAVIWQRYVDVAHLYEKEPSDMEIGPGQAIAVFEDKFAVDGYGYSWNTTPFDGGFSADAEYDYFVVQLPTAGTDLTIGDLSFTESRVPARFVTHTTSDSPLTHETYGGTVTATNSTLVPDADTTVANNTVKSETYAYTFGADGTLTIPNDGDLKLTQTQVGWFIAPDSRDYSDDIQGDCVAVDSQGNSYIGGYEDDDSEAFVMKVSPEGDRLWSVIVYEDEEGDDGDIHALKIHPVTGNIMVLGTVSANYTYSVLYTLDQDTGRILNVTEFKDSDADVTLNTIAWTSTGTYVIGGEKNGQFSAEFPVVPQTGSGVDTIVILRSAVPEVSEINDNWQIGGTGISPFQTVDFVERYTGLTGTTRQGTGATFDITNNGDGTYSVTAYDRGTDYLPGHKIKILGTSISGGATPDNDIIITVVTNDPINGMTVTHTGTAHIDSSIITDNEVSGTNIDVGSGLTFTLRGPFFDNDYSEYYSRAITANGSNYVNGDVIVVPGTSLGGATPANDLTITLFIDQNNFNIDSSQGTSQSSTWKIEAFSQVDFSSEGGVPFGDVTKTSDNQGWGNDQVGNNLPTTGGTGTGLTVDVGDGGSGYSNIVISNPGSGYTTGDEITVTSLDQSISDSFTITASAPTAWSVTYSRDNECLLITPTWQRTFGTDKDTYDDLITLTVDSQDNIIATGQGYGELAADDFEELAVVYKFNSAGTLQWARQLNTASRNSEGHSVVTIGTDIYVTHEDNNSNAFVSKLDSAGTVKWQRRTLGDDITIARTLDGNLLIAVEDNNDGNITIDSNYAIKIFLLTPAGETVWKRWLSPNIAYDSRIGSSGECLVTDTNSFYITGRYNEESEFTFRDWAWAARLPLDGTGTGEYGQFCYTDVNPLLGFYAGGLSDINYDIDFVDIADANNYAGILGDSSDPLINNVAQVTVFTNNTNDYDVSSFYPPLFVETVHDTDGGNIVFADGTSQNTSATDIPQRLFNGVNYTLGLKDRGHHILCTNDLESIRIPYNARVEFPIGTVITIVNPRGDSVAINTEGGSIQVMIPGDDNYSNGGTWLVSEYGMATLLKIGTDSWVLAGNVAPD